MSKLTWRSGQHPGNSVLAHQLALFGSVVTDLDELESIAGIKRGLADVEGGRVTPLAEFEKEFRKKHAIPRRSR